MASSAGPNESRVPATTDSHQAESTKHAASHVEFTFRDVYLTRADMRRIATAALMNQALFKGQEVEFLGTRMTVKGIYVGGNEVDSGLFIATTKPIFRSESARFFLYIQMSREMWEFETIGSGVIIFDKLIQTFLPDLFKRWAELKVRHLVSIVLFTRMEYETEPSERQPTDGSLPTSPNPHPVRDFYRVVVSHMPSADSSAILSQLKKEFRYFLRDVMIRQTTFQWDGTPGTELRDIISGKTALARRGNILEAINLVVAQKARDYIDRDLVRTGLSVMLISPGTGHFEVDENMLRLTTENLVSNGIGIDLVCLSPRPLHTVPIFQYRLPAEKPVPKKSPTTQSASTSPSQAFVNPNDQQSDVSRTSHYPSQYSPAASMGGQSSVPPKKDEEFFAVPHWLETHHYLDPQDPSLTHLYLDPEDPEGKRKRWVPTSRMYEVMMSGIMEIEQSDIKVPFLSETHPQFTGMGTGRPAAPRANGEMPSVEQEAMWMDEYTDLVLRPPLPPESKKAETFRKSAPRPAQPPPINQRRHASAVQYNESLAGNVGSSSSTNSPYGAVPPVLSNLPIRNRAQGQIHKLQPKASQESDVLTVGRSPDIGTKRVGNKSLFLGNRGVSFSKAAATTAGTYDSYDITQSPKTPPKSIKNEDEKSRPETPTGGAQQIKPLTRLNQFFSEPQAQPDPISIQDIIDTGSGRKRDVPQPRRSAAPSSVTRNSPWLTMVNPCKPKKSDFDAANHNRRWQNLYPCADVPETSFMKWKSLCTPAALPLTLAYFPSEEELENDYEESFHKVAVNDNEVEDLSVARGILIRDLLDFRLSKGFQMVQGRSLKSITAGNYEATQDINILEHSSMSVEDATIFLSKGDTIHILCAAENEVQVTRYQRKAAETSFQAMSQQPRSIAYKPFIRTAFATAYEQQTLSLSAMPDEHNWSAIDQHLAGWSGDEYSESLCFWRARFVLLPVEPSRSVHRPVAVLVGDSDDEIHIEGIQKVTQIWDRWRSTAAGERPSQLEGKNPDPNPLALEFQTRDASAVVSAGLEDTVLVGGEKSQPSTRIFSDPYAFKAADIDLHKLAHAIQGDNGIKMKDRRWFFTLHVNCFVGADLVSWLFNNVKDVSSREEAVQLGQKLMDKGLFQHVISKHPFRDGNYFYAVAGEYRDLRADSRTSWFSRKSDKSSVPSTPAQDTLKDLHTPEKPRLRSTKDGHTPESETYTPDKGPHAKPTKVKLSAVLDYNVAARKGSDRPEVIKLHYDRLYNPDSCYHFRLEWLDANPKLIEDAITSWTTTAEKYGLKLVQVPIAEMRTISATNPFRSPYLVRLAIAPPTARPEQYFDHASFTPHYSKQRHGYQRALLKRFNFVLDLEASSNFPSDDIVDVSYSWGKPDYTFSQYLHRSGIVMSQVDSDGNLLFVANRLCGSRAGIPQRGPGKSAAPTPTDIVSELEAFCRDEKRLAAFWEEVASARPSARSTPMLDASRPGAGVPPLEILGGK